MIWTCPSCGTDLGPGECCWCGGVEAAAEDNQAFERAGEEGRFGTCASCGHPGTVGLPCTACGKTITGSALAGGLPLRTAGAPPMRIDRALELLRRRFTKEGYGDQD